MDLINQNNLETRKATINLAEDVSKNKITVDEAMRAIIEMFNKKDEKIQAAIRELKSDQGIYRWFKRYYEDRAKIYGFIIKESLNSNEKINNFAITEARRIFGLFTIK